MKNTDKFTLVGSVLFIILLAAMMLKNGSQWSGWVAISAFTVSIIISLSKIKNSK